MPTAALPPSPAPRLIAAQQPPFEPEQGVPEEDAAPHPSAPAAERAAEEPGRAATALPSVPSARGSRGQAECALEAFAARAKAERRQLKNRRRNQRRREECRRSASDDACLRKGVHEAFAKQSAEREAAPPPPSPRSPAVASSQPTTGQAAPSAAVAGERGSTTLPECVKRDSELLKKLGWRKFVLQRRTKGDFTRLDDVDHPA